MMCLESSSGCARAACALAAIALLGGCAPAGRSVPAAEHVAPAPAVAADARRYRVDPGRSTVRILVYRAGPLARLGHNHVLDAHAVAGEVLLPPGGSPARFTVALPVAALELDAPRARAEEGEEFATVPSEDDVAATRARLVGPEVLDAARYPSIRVDGTAAGDPGVVHATLTVRDRRLALDVPVELSTAPGELVARGGFEVLQSALGIAPFSVALGALRVRDALYVRFSLTAVASPGGDGAEKRVAPGT
jgi:hypothetical protein